MKRVMLAFMFLGFVQVQACLNTISNNTKHTYKIVEIKDGGETTITSQSLPNTIGFLLKNIFYSIVDIFKKIFSKGDHKTFLEREVTYSKSIGNKDMKKQIFLPEEYLKDETKAHTIEPGEEVSFGGHYVPTFMIFKQYPDGKWHSLMVVKQLRCGPRGPENKYLLLTDLLSCKLPDDYRDVYRFTLKKELSEIVDESTNAKELSKVENRYQVVLNLIDDFTQKLQELLSQICDEKAPHGIEDVMDVEEELQEGIPASAVQEKASEGEPAKEGACPMCVG